MNNVTEEQIRLVTKFSKIPLIGRLFSSELTEWKAIVPCKMKWMEICVTSMF